MCGFRTELHAPCVIAWLHPQDKSPRLAEEQVIDKRRMKTSSDGPADYADIRSATG